MEFDHRTQRPTTGGAAARPGEPLPGKRTLTEDLVVQRREPAAASGAGLAASGPAAALPAATQAPATGGPRPPLQALFGSQGVAPPAPSGGRAMPGDVRGKMESAFGADFADVRIHEGPQAAALGAVAYAQGNAIHFQPGRYDPTSTSGQELLGHELAHVVQQRAGAVTPQGKDSPVHDDPALEAQADAMGARAARGEPTGMAPSPTRAPAGAAPVQCYREVSDDGQKWRQSDDLKAMVETNGSPGDRSKNFYADSDAIATADNKLKNAGSFISLTAGDARKGQHRVVPNFIGPGSQQGKVYDHDGPTSGDGLVMPSDCNNAARVVMGIQHAPTDTSDEDDRTAEVPVANQGQDSHQYQRRNFNLNKFGSNTNLVERNGLSELTSSMVEYAKVLPERPIAADKLNNKTNGVDLFLKRAGSLDAQSPVAWMLLHELEDKHAALYQDFNRWSGMNQSARPEVGDALVTFLPDGGAVARTSRNPKAYRAFVEVLKGALADPTQKTGLRKSVTAVAEQAGNEVAGLERARERTIASQQKTQDELRVLREQRDTAQDKTAIDKRISTLTTSTLVLLAGNLKSNAVELERARAIRDLARGLLRKLDDDKVDRGKLARMALQLIGITPDTEWQTARDNISQTGLAFDRLGDDIGGGLVEAIKHNDLWNKHWGGVVMTLGTDYVTLENDASTAPESGPNLNTQWGFAMYGSKTPGQSFHDQMMQTGDFGTFAVTARFTAPGTKSEKAQRGRALRPDPNEQLWQSFDQLFQRIGTDAQGLLRVLGNLALRHLRTLEERYTSGALDVPGAEIQQAVVALLPKARQRHLKPQLPSHDVHDWGGPSEHDPGSGKNHPLGQPPPSTI